MNEPSVISSSMDPLTCEKDHSMVPGPVSESEDHALFVTLPLHWFLSSTTRCVTRLDVMGTINYGTSLILVSHG